MADIETGKAYQVLDPFACNAIEQIQKFKIDKKLYKKGFGFEVIQQVLIDFLNVCRMIFLKKAKSMKDLEDFEVGLGESFKIKINFPTTVESTREPPRELHKNEKSKGFEIGD